MLEYFNIPNVLSLWICSLYGVALWTRMLFWRYMWHHFVDIKGTALTPTQAKVWSEARCRL